MLADHVIGPRASISWVHLNGFHKTVFVTSSPISYPSDANLPIANCPVGIRRGGFAHVNSDASRPPTHCAESVPERVVG